MLDSCISWFSFSHERRTDFVDRSRYSPRLSYCPILHLTVIHIAAFPILSATQLLEPVECCMAQILWQYLLSLPPSPGSVMPVPLHNYLGLFELLSWCCFLTRRAERSARVMCVGSIWTKHTSRWLTTRSSEMPFSPRCRQQYLLSGPLQSCGRVWSVCQQR